MKNSDQMRMYRLYWGNLPTKFAVWRIDAENTCNFNILKNVNLVNS